MNEIFETEQNEEIVASVPDETGLTNHQKVALIGAWSMVKKDIIVHGRNIFVRFFEENPKYLNYFDFSQDKTASEIGENKSLHAHALNVMHFIGTLIDYGLHNPPMFKCSLSKMMKNHRKHGVNKEDVTGENSSVNLYFINVNPLSNACSQFSKRRCSTNAVLQLSFSHTNSFKGEIVCEVIMKYCLEVLDQHRSSTLEMAFSSLMKSIADTFNE